MDRNRRSTRHLESTDDFNQTSTGAALRASTMDSGRGSMATNGQTSAPNSAMSNGATSTLSRDTPLDGDDNNADEKCQNDRTVSIPSTPVLQYKCYERAFVSHIDHPSAFFVQLAHFHQRFMELNEEINEFYSQNSTTNRSKSWKRGDYCIAKFNDDQFYRARIIETPANTKTPGLCDVVYLDFGNWTKVPIADIHPLLPKFATLSAQAVPCSLTKTLPRSGTWSQHPKAMELFKELVFEKFVDVTFYPKTIRDFWPLTFTDLVLSESKIDVRHRMKEENLIQEVPNEQIYVEFNELLKPADYIIYSIPHEDEECDDE